MVLNPWKFSLKTQTWTQIFATGDAPPPFVGNTMAVYGTRIVVLNYNDLSTLHYYDVETNTWTGVQTTGFLHF